MSGTRRTHLTAVVACLAGAGLALYAVTRVWSLEIERRPGLPDLRTEQTGADLQPWLVGLAVVALAGTGALLATRGTVRRGLGGLLALAGAGVIVGAVLARTGTDAGEAGGGAIFWAVACGLGGAAIAVGGVLAARHGHRWATMSSRYERSTAPAAPTPEPPAPAVDGEPTAPSPAAPAPGRTAVDSRAFWEALDRGEDPTR